MAEDHVCVALRVTGRVQGVSYRAWAAERGRALGLSGWVRNRDDGAVEACLEGPAGAIAEMRAALAEGPPAARVESVEETGRPPGCDAAGMEIRR